MPIKPLEIKVLKSGEKVKLLDPLWKAKPDDCKCPECKKQIYTSDKDIEYIKTKRGTVMYIHTGCIKTRGGGVRLGERKELDIGRGAVLKR